MGSMTDVSSLVAQMQETLATIHTTLASLDTAAQDEKLDELEKKRDDAIRALSAAFSTESEALHRRRQVEREVIAERRRKEDEERDRKRREEDALLAAREREEDEARGGKLKEETEEIEQETDNLMSQAEEDARVALVEGYDRLRALQEKRRELNRLIEEKMELSLPTLHATPIRSRRALRTGALPRVVSEQSHPPEPATAAGAPADHSTASLSPEIKPSPPPDIQQLERQAQEQPEVVGVDLLPTNRGPVTVHDDQAIEHKPDLEPRDQPTTTNIINESSQPQPDLSLAHLHFAKYGAPEQRQNRDIPGTISHGADSPAAEMVEANTRLAHGHVEPVTPVAKEGDEREEPLPSSSPTAQDEGTVHEGQVAKDISVSEEAECGHPEVSVETVEARAVPLAHYDADSNDDEISRRSSPAPAPSDNGAYHQISEASGPAPLPDIDDTSSLPANGYLSEDVDVEDNVFNHPDPSFIEETERLEREVYGGEALGPATSHEADVEVGAEAVETVPHRSDGQVPVSTVFPEPGNSPPSLKDTENTEDTEFIEEDDAEVRLQELPPPTSPHQEEKLDNSSVQSVSDHDAEPQAAHSTRLLQPQSNIDSQESAPNPFLDISKAPSDHEALSEPEHDGNGDDEHHEHDEYALGGVSPDQYQIHGPASESDDDYHHRDPGTAEKHVPGADEPGYHGAEHHDSEDNYTDDESKRHEPSSKFDGSYQNEEPGTVGHHVSEAKQLGSHSSGHQTSEDDYTDNDSQRFVTPLPSHQSLRAFGESQVNPFHHIGVTSAEAEQHSDESARQYELGDHHTTTVHGEDELFDDDGRSEGPTSSFGATATEHEDGGDQEAPLLSGRGEVMAHVEVDAQMPPHTRSRSWVEEIGGYFDDEDEPEAEGPSPETPPARPSQISQHSADPETSWVELQQDTPPSARSPAKSLHNGRSQTPTEHESLGSPEYTTPENPATRGETNVPWRASDGWTPQSLRTVSTSPPSPLHVIPQTTKVEPAMNNRPIPDSPTYSAPSRPSPQPPQHQEQPEEPEEEEPTPGPSTPVYHPTSRGGGGGSGLWQRREPTPPDAISSHGSGGEGSSGGHGSLFQRMRSIFEQPHHHHHHQHRRRQGSTASGMSVPSQSSRPSSDAWGAGQLPEVPSMSPVREQWGQQRFESVLSPTGVDFGGGVEGHGEEERSGWLMGHQGQH